MTAPLPVLGEKHIAYLREARKVAWHRNDEDESICGLESCNFLRDIEAHVRALVAGEVVMRRYNPESLDALLLEAQEFQRITFPASSPEGAAEHLRREVLELCENPHDTEEQADVFLLLSSVVQNTGSDLAAAVRAKLDKCKSRKWGKPDAHGVVEHIRDDVVTPQTQEKP